MSTVLQPTYGGFTLRGIVTGLQRDGAYQEEDSWRKISFFVKTSKTNSVPVELIGFKNETVKFRNDDNDKIDVPWKDRYKERKDGYKIMMPVVIGIEKDEEGNNKKKELVQYDAVKYIYENLKDGDSVFVTGSIQFSEYTNQEGKTRTIDNLIINKIFKTSEPVDFDAEDFQEMSSFNQEIVYLNSLDDDDTGKVLINTYILTKKKGEVIPVEYSFVINPKKYELDEEKFQKINKMINSFKNLPFGSTIKIKGLIINGVILEKQEVEDDFGGFDVPGQEEFIRDRIKEYEITSGDGKTLVKGRYKEEDFILNNDNTLSGFEVVNIEDEDELPF